MSRSGYSDDCEPWDLIRWRGAVKSAIRGQRGQRFLQELADAMDAMPEKRLIANYLKADGAYCTLGVVGAARGLDLTKIDPEDRYAVAEAFEVAEALSAEIMFMNDEGGSYNETPERRWQRMRAWVTENMKTPNAELTGRGSEET